jgi:nitrate/nitrite transporter NarK
LIGGAGLLGVFPLYYSFSQDISRHRMGLVTGLAGAMGWMISSRFQVLFGRWADLDGSYSRGMVMAALLPLVAMIAFAWFWPEDDSVVSKERSSDG